MLCLASILLLSRQTYGHSFIGVRGDTFFFYADKEGRREQVSFGQRCRKFAHQKQKPLVTSISLEPIQTYVDLQYINTQ